VGWRSIVHLKEVESKKKGAVKSGRERRYRVTNKIKRKSYEEGRKIVSNIGTRGPGLDCALGRLVKIWVENKGR